MKFIMTVLASFPWKTCQTDDTCLGEQFLHRSAAIDEVFIPEINDGFPVVHCYEPNDTEQHSMSVCKHVKNPVSQSDRFRFVSGH